MKHDKLTYPTLVHFTPKFVEVTLRISDDVRISSVMITLLINEISMYVITIHNVTDGQTDRQTTNYSNTALHSTSTHVLHVLCALKTVFVFRYSILYITSTIAGKRV